MNTQSLELLERAYEPLSMRPVLEFAGVAIEERDAEIALLRERLSYYEGFDAIIGESVRRAAELFRSMFEEREAIRSAGAQKQATFDAEVALAATRMVGVEREQFHATLLDLMNDAAHMQGQLEALMQRISGAFAATKLDPPVITLLST